MNLNKLIRDLRIEHKVVSTDHAEDIKAALAALDVSVLPSVLPEPFGGVVVESMAMGKPVIGTRTGGTIEQIKDGVTGYLVAPNDPRQLAAALERLLENAQLRARMGENGRERFRKHFEFECFYEKMSTLYNELVQRRP